MEIKDQVLDAMKKAVGQSLAPPLKLQQHVDGVGGLAMALAERNTK